MTERERLLADILLLEGVMRLDPMNKTAQMSGLLSGLFDSTKSYVSDHIDPENKTASIINLLVPGILSALGHPGIAVIVEVLKYVFGLDIGSIVAEVAHSIADLIKGGKVSSHDIETTTNAVVHKYQGEGEEGPGIADRITEVWHKIFPTKTSFDRRRELLKLALLEIDAPVFLIIKSAGAGDLKSKGLSILAKVIGFVLKTMLFSGGFMVAEDIFGKLTGITPTGKDGKPIPGSLRTPVKAVEFKGPTQTLFKVSPTYHEEKYNQTDPWTELEPISGMGATILQWTEEIYPGTKEVIDQVPSTAGFQKLMQLLQEYNQDNTSNVSFIPKLFTSRKSVVDTFIDDLAEKTKRMLPSAEPKKELQPA